MWEYEVMIKETKEILIIFGYNFVNACFRANINPDSVLVLKQDYID